MRTYLALRLPMFLILSQFPVGCSSLSPKQSTPHSKYPNTYLGITHEWAEQGDVDSQIELGVRYAQGDGVPKDGNEAVKWLRMADDQGSARAQFNLGNMYDNGLGVPQNDAEAVRWYRRAAENGHAGAQYYLGLQYEKGAGVPQDDTKATSWYRKAAASGDARAQLQLGLSYAAGNGVSHDPIQAHMWINLACAQSLSYERQSIGRRALSMLAENMTQEQVVEAQRLATDWAQRHPRRNNE